MQFGDPCVPMFLQWVEGTSFEVTHDFRIGALGLIVALRVSHGGVANAGADFFTIFHEGMAGELRAMVGDDAVWDSKSGDDALDELNGEVLVNLGNLLGLRPLSEFIDGDVEVFVTSRGRHK